MGKTRRTDTCVSWDHSTLHRPARPPATVITLSQSKLWGNLGRKGRSCSSFWFQGQPVRSEWKSRQSCMEVLWRKECRQPSEHWDRSIMKHYVPVRPISAGNQPSLAAEVLQWGILYITVLLFETDLLKVWADSSILFCSWPPRPPPVRCFMDHHMWKSARSHAWNGDTTDSCWQCRTSEDGPFLNVLIEII